MQAGCPALLAGAHSFCFRLKGLALFSLEIFSEREREGMDSVAGVWICFRSLDEWLDLVQAQYISTSATS
jgi:hypothetical protein